MPLSPPRAAGPGCCWGRFWWRGPPGRGWAAGPRPPTGGEITAAARRGGPPARAAPPARGRRRAGQGSDRLVLALQACEATISGLVTDQATGASVTGARVLVLPARNAHRLVGPATVTESAGQYEICVSSGDLLVRVEAVGYAIT